MLKPKAHPPAGAGCAAFACNPKGAPRNNSYCDTALGTCDGLCYSPIPPINSVGIPPADYPRKCNTDPTTGLPDATDGPLEARFAVSRDGRNFTRLSRRPFVPRGRGKPRPDPRHEGRYLGVFDGEFDSGSTTVAVGSYDVGDSTIMLEAGWQLTHGGLDTVLSPTSAPSLHPGLFGGPVQSGLQVHNCDV